MSAGDEWAAVDGDRDEDLGQGGGQLPGGGAWEAVVDDSVVLAGVRGFLSDVPGIPRNFFAWFYLGLGAGLLSAGIRFLIRWWKGRGITV